MTGGAAIRLCAFGDSFVHGVGDPEGLGWLGRACAGPRRRGVDLTCYNLGIRRDTSADIRKRWRDEAAVRCPPGFDGRLVFSFGVNDCVVENGARRVAAAETLANAEAILEPAGRLHPTLVIGPPPIADRSVNTAVWALSMELGCLCDRLGAPYLPTFEALAACPAWMGEVAAGDGAHPGEHGYVALAALVTGWPAWRDGFGGVGAESPHKGCA